MGFAIEVTPERFRLAETFTISRGSRDAVEVLTVTVRAAGVTGRGECLPYARYGETMEGVAEAIRALDGRIGMPDAGGLPPDLAAHLPPGAARNGLDCALWDWCAKRAGRRAWELVPGWPAPRPVQTAYTLSLDLPERMRAAAARHAHRPLLKIKLGGEGDMARLEAVRAGAPATRIIVDANEGWSAAEYTALAPHLKRLGVALVEQPLPAAEDGALAGIARPVPVCADESCHDRATLPGLKGKYDIVNIKLDKTGGLGEAMALYDAARAEGYGVMVGCMMATSLSIAPATIVAAGADIVDLDASLLLAEDRDPPLAFDAEGLHPPDAALWG